MPQSEAQRAENRKRNLEEARALQAAGKPLEAKHITALNRGKRKATKVESGITEDILSKDKSIVDDPKYGAASKILKQMGQHKSAFSAIGYQTRDLKSNPRAINSDKTNHAQMGTLGDYLSEKLDTAHESGLLPSHNPGVKRGLDKDLLAGHNSLEKSEIAHDKGYVEEAKSHMKSAADSYYKVAVALGSRGVAVKSDAHKVAHTIANAYINSKTPGVGAAPHEGFRSTKISNKPYVAPKNSPAESSVPKAKNKDYARLSKSYEGFTPDISSFNDEREPEATSSNVVSQQLKNYFDGR